VCGGKHTTIRPRSGTPNGIRTHVTGPTDDERADQITIERLATASQPLGT